MTWVTNNLTDSLNRVAINPIIYDQVAVFNDMTSYPMQRRKSELNSPQTLQGRDAQLHSYNVFFEESHSCYDNQWYSDLFFWKPSGYFCDDSDNFRYNEL